MNYDDDCAGVGAGREGVSAFGGLKLVTTISDDLVQAALAELIANGGWPAGHGQIPTNEEGLILERDVIFPTAFFPTKNPLCYEAARQAAEAAGRGEWVFSAICIPPLGILRPHTDGCFTDAMTITLHAGPSCTFEYDRGAQSVVMKPGEVWLFDGSIMHGVKNLDPTWRYALIAKSLCEVTPEREARMRATSAREMREDAVRRMAEPRRPNNR